MIDELKGIKQSELTPCGFCGKGVCHSNQIASARIRYTRLLVNFRAVQRQTGLEMMIGPLATVMGPDEDMLKEIAPERTFLICDDCAMRRYVCELMEIEDPAPSNPVSEPKPVERT